MSVLAVTALLVLARGAGADWTPPTQLSQRGGGAAPLWLGYARDGTGFAMWNVGTSRGMATQTDQRSSAGAWERARTVGLSGTSSSSGAVGIQPGAAAALAPGRVVASGVVMSRAGDTVRDVGYVLSTRGTVLETRTLASGSWKYLARYGGVDIAGDGKGKAVAVWARLDEGLFISRVTSRSGFSPTQHLARSVHRRPSVALGGRDTVAVAWNDGTRIRVMVSTDGGRSFAGALKLGRTQGGAEQGGNPVVAVSPAGAVLVAWATQAGEAETASYGTGYFRYAYRRPGHDRFDPGVQLYRDTHDGTVGGVQVAFDAAGEPFVAWQAWESISRPQVAVARATPTGPAAVQTVTTGYGRLASLAAGAGNRAAVSWIAVTATSAESNLGVQASVRGPGGTFGAPEQISADPAGANPMLAYRPDGRLTAIWSTGSNRDSTAVLTSDRR